MQSRRGEREGCRVAKMDRRIIASNARGTSSSTARQQRYEKTKQQNRSWRANHDELAIHIHEQQRRLAGQKEGAEPMCLYLTIEIGREIWY